MPLFRADVVMPMFTGLARDVVVNTFHFENATADKEEMAANMEVVLKPFYEAIYGAGAADRVSYIDWTMVKARVFDLSEPTPRVAAESLPFFTSAGLGGSTIPTEVACVASFQSAGLPGEVYQRRYNRIYLGALIPNRFEESTSTDFPRFTTGFQLLVTNAMKALQAAAPGPSTLWVQVSNATGSPRSLPVTGGWMDNSPDTQRRRSVDSTSRTNWVPD